MPLPSVEDVNETRVAKFTDSITEALGSEKLDFFRDLVNRYEQEHDVTAADAAAALAVMAQDGQPLLLEPDPEPAPRVFEGKREKTGAWDHEKGRRRDQGGEPGRRRDSGPRRGRSDVPMATYTIAVGKRHKVEPRQIVGAIANEGGLGRADFGHIDIRGDHSLVELPADLPRETWKALENTRISGKLIELTETSGSAARASSAKKPRHRKGGDHKAH
jgi:ATP-dependent RNA helicase DeaD